MNRVKVWAYTVLVAAVSVAALRAELLERRAEAIAAVDARLAAGAALVSASTRAVAREASAAAAATARDATLVAALEAKDESRAPLLPRKRPRGAPPPGADDETREAALRDAARAALASAEKTFGFALPDGTVITAGNREWLARKGDPSVAEGEAMALLRAAIGGKAQRGWVRLNGALFHAAASPAGPASGLVVLVPLDEAWVKAAAAAAGAEVTLSAPDVKPVSTLRGDAAVPFTAWAAGAGAPTGVGRLGAAQLALGPVKVPRLPQPWGTPPAYRAHAVALDGVKDGAIVLAAPTSALGALAESHYRGLAIVLGLFLAGVAVGFLVRTGQVPAALPEALVAAAARIERGDFAARAPVLTGRLGTISGALNKAADLGAALAAASAPGVSTTGMTGIEPFAARPLAPEPAPEPPAPAPAPQAAAPAAPAALLQAAALTAAPGTVEVDEETHWQQIFQDFLRTRASCGEATEGLTYDKFRLKLDGNKSALVAKYGCRSVKFQVYVKEGKAALRATPVK